MNTQPVEHLFPYFVRILCLVLCLVSISSLEFNKRIDLYKLQRSAAPRSDIGAQRKPQTVSPPPILCVWSEKVDTEATDPTSGVNPSLPEGVG